MFRFTKKDNSGITMIALIITIIVLLILASITLASLSGENGIIKKAHEAKNATESRQEQENNEINNILGYLPTDQTKEPTGDLTNHTCVFGEITYTPAGPLLHNSCQKCTVEGCTMENAMSEEHTFNEDGICKKCNYNNHTHTWTITGYTEVDDTTHLRLESCSCGESQKIEENHTFENGICTLCKYNTGNTGDTGDTGDGELCVGSHNMQSYAFAIFVRNGYESEALEYYDKCSNCPYYEYNTDYSDTTNNECTINTIHQCVEKCVVLQMATNPADMENSLVWVVKHTCTCGAVYYEETDSETINRTTHDFGT